MKTGSRSHPHAALLGAALLCSSGALACERQDAATNAARPDPPAADAKEAAPAEPELASEPATSLTERLTAWLDPDARGVVFSRTPAAFDPEAVATLFALPSSGERMLRQLQSADEGFELMLGEGAVDEWFETPALAMWPVVAQGTYAVRLLKKPQAELAAALSAADFEATEVEGLKVFVPRGAYPYKLVLLDRDAVGFVPLREIGSGVGPLTAARDLPPSELELQLSASLRQDPDALLEVLVQGPLVHMDLLDPVAMVRLTLRRWQQGGVDGALALQPMGALDDAVERLQARDGAFETDRMREVMGRVAFLADGPMVIGRLQLPAAERSVIEAHS